MDSKVGLKDMINAVHAYSKKWCFAVNVTKCAVVVFSNEKIFDGKWFWGKTGINIKFKVERESSRRLCK